MRRWIAGSVATILVSAGTVAAAPPRDPDSAPAKPTAKAARPAPPKPDLSESPSDFPPPIDPPMQLQSESDFLNARPVQATPAARSSIMLPPVSATSSTPSPFQYSSPLQTDAAPAACGGCAAGGPMFDWPAPQGRIHGRVYGSADFLLLWTRRGTNPPLVQTVSPENANIGLTTGELPDNSTINIFGGDGTDPGALTGVKGTIGLWLGECSDWGVELGYFQLFRDSDQFSIASTGVPVIGRNFFDVASGRNAFLFYSNPNGLQRGFINIDAPTQAEGGELNVRYHTLAIISDRTEFIAGFRYFNLREALSINSGADFLDPTGAVTQTFVSNEFFRARNDFYGGQIGIEDHFYYGCWTLDLSSKVALGNVRQSVVIDGGTTQTIAGQPAQNFPAQSLLFVQPTNIGVYNRDRFSVVPEFSVKLGYQLSQKVRATIGYEFIALTDAVRAGSAIDPAVNPNNTQFITARAPSNALNPLFHFNDSTWWAQGLTAGIAFNY
jgi:Putative beta barrel porin-7 (BBP7)